MPGVRVKDLIWKEQRVEYWRGYSLKTGLAGAPRPPNSKGARARLAAIAGLPHQPVYNLPQPSTAGWRPVRAVLG